MIVRKTLDRSKICLTLWASVFVQQQFTPVYIRWPRSMERNGEFSWKSEILYLQKQNHCWSFSMYITDPTWPVDLKSPLLSTDNNQQYTINISHLTFHCVFFWQRATPLRERPDLHHTRCTLGFLLFYLQVKNGKLHDKGKWVYKWPEES